MLNAEVFVPYSVNLSLINPNAEIESSLRLLALFNAKELMLSNLENKDHKKVLKIIYNLHGHLQNFLLTPKELN